MRRDGSNEWLGAWAGRTPREGPCLEEKAKAGPTCVCKKIDGVECPAKQWNAKKLADFDTGADSKNHGPPKNWGKSPPHLVSSQAKEQDKGKRQNDIDQVPCHKGPEWTAVVWPGEQMHSRNCKADAGDNQLLSCGREHLAAKRMERRLTDLEFRGAPAR